MPWMQWRACMWLKLSLFGLVLCPDWRREDAGVGDRSKEVVEVCSHHRWETSLGLSYVCAHGWAETLLVMHLLGRLSPEEIWSAEDSDLKMWGADRDMIRSFHSLSLIHISEPTRLRRISYAVFCLKKKKQKKKK